MTRDLKLAALFQALADPTRLRILALLRTMELSVGELAQLLAKASRVFRATSNPQQLGPGRTAQGRQLGLSAARRCRANRAACSIFTKGWTPKPSSCSPPMRPGWIRSAHDRAEAARRYFEAHAATWDSIRSLHIADAEIERAIAGLLADRPIGALLDIGTGTGRMLELFAPQGRQRDRHRSLFGNAAPGAGQARGSGHFRRQPAPGRHVRITARRPLRRQHHSPPGAPLCAAAGRSHCRGGAGIGARRPTAGDRLRRSTTAPSSRNRTRICGLVSPMTRCAAGSPPPGLSSTGSSASTAENCPSFSGEAEKSGADREERAAGMNRETEIALNGHAPLFAEARGDIAVSFEFFPPKSDADGRDAMAFDRDACTAEATVRLGDLWRRRIDPRTDPRHGRADRPRDRPYAGRAPDLRRCDTRGNRRNRPQLLGSRGAPYRRAAGRLA